MASVTQEILNSNHEKISVSITKNDYSTAVDSAIKKYSKNIQLQGFRKGMVPMGIIKKMYGQSIFADEVLKVAGAELEKYLTEQKKAIFARPLPAESQNQLQLEINNPQDYLFEFEIGTQPTFTIPLLNNNETLPLYKVNISSQTIDDEIEHLRTKTGTRNTLETITTTECEAKFSAIELDTNGSIKESGIEKEITLSINLFTDTYCSQWMEKKVGDTLALHIQTDIEENKKEEFAHLLGLKELNEHQHWNLTCKEISIIEKSALGKEMFDKVFPGKEIETEDLFRKQLHDEIQKQWDEQAKIKLHNDLFERLVHETPIDLPVIFLKRWMSIGGEKYITPEEVEKKYASFDHQMRWQLISTKIIEENNITVTTPEITEQIKAQLAGYFGGMPLGDDTGWMQTFIDKQLKDAKYREEIENKIITEKVFSTIEQKLNLQETPIDEKEFMALPSMHHHHH